MDFVLPVFESPPTSRSRVESICRDLIRLSGSSFGPWGKFKILKSSADTDGVIAVTSTSSKIFSLSNFTSSAPVLSILLRLLQNHVSAFGDAGHFVVQCTCLFLLKGFKVINDGIHVTTVISSLEFGLDHLLSFVLSNTCPCRILLSLSDAVSVRKVVKSILCAKNVVRLSPKEVAFLSTIILQAVLHTLSPEYPGSSNIIPFVRLSTHFGSSVTESSLFENSILIDIPIRRQVKLFLQKLSKGNVEEVNKLGCREYPKNEQVRGKKRENFALLLFDISIVDERSISFGELQLQKDCGEEDLQKRPQWDDSYHLKVKKFVSNVVAAGVSIVASQKLICIHVQAALLAYNILPLERLSLRHIKAVGTMTGAKICSSWGIEPLDPAHLGTIFQISLVELQNSEYVLLKHHEISPNCKNIVTRPVSSILLCAPTEMAVRELKGIVERLVTAITIFLQSPIVMPGAGVTEFFMGESLLQRASVLQKDDPFINILVSRSLECKSRESLHRDAQRCLRDVMADTFFEIVLNLFHREAIGQRGLDKVQLLSQFRNFNDFQTTSVDRNGAKSPEDSKRAYFGCGIDKHGDACVREIDVFDIFTPKVEGIRAAIETACVLLRSSAGILIHH